MRKSRIYALLLVLAALLSATACAETSVSSGEISDVTEESSTERQAQSVIAFDFTTAEAKHADARFLPDYSQLEIKAAAGAEVHYTLDGSVPTKESAVYSEPIVLEQFVGDFPHCVVLRAKAYNADGTESDTETQTFWTAFDVNARFHNPVISIVGNPKEITEKPDGIFTGDNVKLRGRESERGISVEMVDRSGNLLLAQDAGLRIYGAASREASLKSMKLFARKSYDPDHGKFAYDGFGTTGADGEIIGKYDKLVVRNTGNDFQFAFIRDELFQTLAAQAGRVDTEAVQAVVVYLNGEYYGLQWLHESVCNDLLKDKFGADTGKYVVLEGKEEEKSVSETDDEEAAAAEEFNTRYAELSALDLTDDANFAEVEAFFDVPQYLDYFAFNICINNRDWPQNNQKCYRYYAGDGEEYATDPNSRMDGRWRFWYHDMDYSAGLYEQDETQSKYDNLAQIMTAGSERYAPLFTALMQREDCRTAFIAEVQRLMGDVLSAEGIRAALDTLDSERFMEMKRYFDNLEQRKKSDRSIWTSYQIYRDQQKFITSFADTRADYMQQFLDKAFGQPAETTTAD